MGVRRGLTFLGRPAGPRAEQAPLHRWTLAVTLLAAAWPVGLLACLTWLVVAALLRISSLSALVWATLNSRQPVAAATRSMRAYWASRAAASSPSTSMMTQAPAPSGRAIFRCRATARRLTASMISAAEGTMSSCSIRCTRAQPSSMEANRRRRTPRSLGMGMSRSSTRVMTPKVPSEPVNRLVRS